MDYFCGYYPRPGDTAKQCSMEQKSAKLSLLIQHCEYRQGEVLLACIVLSGQETEALMESLFCWFRGLVITKEEWRDTGRTARKWKRELGNLFDSVSNERQNGRGTVSICGALCFGGKAILFYNGAMRMFSVQEDIGRMYFCPLSIDGTCTKSDIVMEVVAVRPNVGILITTQELAEQIQNVKLNECLKMRTITGEEQLQKQLEELIAVAEEASVANSADAGAIVIKMGGKTHDRRLA